MRLLIALCLVILIVCIFYFPLEGFEVMTRETAIKALTVSKPPLTLIDNSGNPLPTDTIAKNLGDLLKAIRPEFTIRPVEPDFTATDPKLVAPLLKADLRADVLHEVQAAVSPMLLQGNEMLRQVTVATD
jgi:hypothetical protein